MAYMLNEICCYGCYTHVVRCCLNSYVNQTWLMYDYCKYKESIIVLKMIPACEKDYGSINNSFKIVCTSIVLTHSFSNYAN